MKKNRGDPKSGSPLFEVPRLGAKQLVGGFEPLHLGNPVLRYLVPRSGVNTVTACGPGEKCAVESVAFPLASHLMGLNVNGAGLRIRHATTWSIASLAKKEDQKGRGLYDPLKDQVTKVL